MKKIYAAFMAAFFAVATFSGCAIDVSDLETAGDLQNDMETETAAPETADKTSPEETKKAEETTAEQTIAEETTADDSAYGWDSLGDKYRALMKMDIDDARKYFGVTVDESLGEEDFLEFCDLQISDAVSSDRLTLHQYMENPEIYDIDINDIPYDLGKAYTTLEDQRESYEVNIKELKSMLAIPENSLTEREQLTYDKLYYEFIKALWSEEVMPLSSPIGSSGSVISDIGSIFYEYAFNDTDDVDEYLEILYQLPDYIATIPEGIQYQYDSFGYAPTDEMLQDSIDAALDIVNDDENVFIDGFDSKIDELGLDEETAEQYRKTNREFVENSLMPAFMKCSEKLNKFSGLNKDGTGIADIEDGRDYYECLLEYQTGSGMTPEEIMDMLEGYMDTAIDKLIIQANLNSYIYENYYNGDYEFPVNGAEEIIEYLEENMGGEFPELSDVDVTISYLPKSLQIEGVGAYYNTPQFDSAQTNVIRVNGAEEMDLYLVIAHEGYPGHMLQHNVMQNNGSLLVENICNDLGYVEGWAMIAYYRSIDHAQLSATMSKVMYYDTMFSYDMDVCADIAVNYLGWDADELSDYLTDLGLGDSFAQALYEYAVENPANLAPYSVGFHLTDEIIEELVDCGSTYSESYRAFLNIGSTSFDIVKRYIGSEF